MRLEKDGKLVKEKDRHLEQRGAGINLSTKVLAWRFVATQSCRYARGQILPGPNAIMLWRASGHRCEIITGRRNPFKTVATDLLRSIQSHWSCAETILRDLNDQNVRMLSEGKRRRRQRGVKPQEPQSAPSRDGNLSNKRSALVPVDPL